MNRAFASCPARLRVAVVGAGWAGLAAAVGAVQAGQRVTLFEAARQAGGRARSLPCGHLLLDNGQHILIGAYTESLRLMQTVGVDLPAALQRLPLSLRFADGAGLALPASAALPPLARAGLGIALARGWRWRDKAALLAAATRWHRSGFAADAQLTVTQLCRGLSGQLMAEFIEPLCVSALNTPASQASAAVFLRVLHDALLGPALAPGAWGRLAASDLLLPRQPLGALLADPALAWLRAQGCQTRLGCRVEHLDAIVSIVGGAVTTPDSAQYPQKPHNIVQARCNAADGAKNVASDAASDAPSDAPTLPEPFCLNPPLCGWRVNGETFDRVILACPPAEAARLVAQAAAGLSTSTQLAEREALIDWAASASGFAFEAITTVYARCAQPWRWNVPMLALRGGGVAHAAQPAQFVFDRGPLTVAAAPPAPAVQAVQAVQGPRLLAFVVSTSRGVRADIQAQVVAQARAELGLAVTPLQTVVEKRATFACTPALARPCQRIWQNAQGAPLLLAAGDWCQGIYPATLEGAVRSGQAAARSLTGT